MPRFLLARFDRAGRIPWWARKLWPTAHFCNEWDGLLIDDSVGEWKCCQGRCGG